jgi:hypothetical protein
VAAEPTDDRSRRGLPWTADEDAELVADMRAGTSLTDIASAHGRTLGAITSRLAMMAPADANVPDNERVSWVVTRLADPAFDWRTPLRRTATEPLVTPAEVLTVWQSINDFRLSEQRRSEFLARPELADLVHFGAESLRTRGEALRHARGNLVLGEWAAECAMPGLVALLASDAADAVRGLVAAVISTLSSEADRSILERRLGLSTGLPQTLAAIGDESGISRERIRQRQEKALRELASATRTRDGYTTARRYAQNRLAERVKGTSGSISPERLATVAQASFAQVESGFAAMVIMRAAGYRKDEARKLQQEARALAETARAAGRSQRPV